MDMNYHLMFKILLIGDTEVGKSALLHPSVDDSSCSSTIGVHFLKKKLEIGGKKIKLQVWNITGQESSQAITASYYHDTHGFLLMYDVTDESSFQHIGDWLIIIKKHASEKDFQKLLFANKCDCERTRQVSRERGEAFARYHGMRYVEGTDLDEAIKMLTEDILNKNYTEPFVEGSELLSDFD